MRIYPAIRAQMGDWRYYIVRMKMREIANNVRFGLDIYRDNTLSDAMQRALDRKQVKTAITSYLARHPDRLFSSIVVVASKGEPTWNPVEIDSTAVPKIMASSNSLGDSFGLLTFGSIPNTTL